LSDFDCNCRRFQTNDFADKADKDKADKLDKRNSGRAQAEIRRGEWKFEAVN